VTFRIRPEGMKELEAGISSGMVLAGEEVAVRGKANIAPYRDTGAVEDSIRVIDVYADDWPNPAVIVTTGSGDGFFVHEGTVDTPARPFFTQALDSVIEQIPGFLKRGFDVSRRTGGTPGMGDRVRSDAFHDLNRRFGGEITSK
jgi:hypothetical protein